MRHRTFHNTMLPVVVGPGTGAMMPHTTQILEATCIAVFSDRGEGESEREFQADRRERAAVVMGQKPSEVHSL